jgi:hypothetical protein
MTEEPRKPIVPPGGPAQESVIVLILARYYPGPITNPEHEAYVHRFVTEQTEVEGKEW